MLALAGSFGVHPTALDGITSGEIFGERRQVMLVSRRRYYTPAMEELYFDRRTTSRERPLYTDVMCSLRWEVPQLTNPS